jgi:hypothetical protein
MSRCTQQRIKAETEIKKGRTKQRYQDIGERRSNIHPSRTSQSQKNSREKPLLIEMTKNFLDSFISV